MDDLIYINNKPLSNFNAEMEWGYSVGGNQITIDTFKGKNRTTLNVLSKDIGTKSFVAALCFFGTIEERTINKSSFDMECIQGNITVNIGDGFEYHVVCNSLGEESVNEAFTETQYSFIGFRKKPLKSITGNTIHCFSTVPQTDCRLTVKVGATNTNYRLWNGYFSVVKNDVIIFDGIKKQVLINGANRADKAKFVEFPYLVPGINTILCADIVTTEYNPTYL